MAFHKFFQNLKNGYCLQKESRFTISTKVLVGKIIVGETSDGVLCEANRGLGIGTSKP